MKNGIMARGAAVILFFATVGCISVGIFVNSLMERNALKAAIANAEAEIAAAEDRIDRYEHDLNSEIDDEYVERVARERLGLIKPDELVIQKKYGK